MPLEKMDEFFNIRADTYDSHMLDELQLEEFYSEITACFAGRKVKHLLDLGVGTGLELEGLFRRFPDMEVTGIDLSPGMLKKLREKFPGKSLRTVCGSYLEVLLEPEGYDHILSTYSLHHFVKADKLALYHKTYAALQPGGLFVYGDYTVPTAEIQRELLEEQRRMTARDTAMGAYHQDIPFTAEAEKEMLEKAGFSRVEMGRGWESASILLAYK